MKLRLIARRYAEAFIEYGKEALGLERTVDEIGTLTQIIRDNPEFQKMLTNPELSITEKYEVVDSALRGFSQELKQFLKLIIEKHRIEVLGDILDYVIFTYSQAGTVDVVIKSAHPLEPGAAETLKGALRLRAQKKARFSVLEDASLLGGVQVMIGNMVIDGSLRKRVEELGDVLRSHEVT